MPQAIGGALGSAGSFLGSLPSTVSNWFSPSVAAGIPSDTSVAAGVTGTPAGAPGAFPSPGLPPVDLASGMPAPLTAPSSAPNLSLLPTDGSSGGGMAAPAPDLLSGAGGTGGGAPFGNITPPAVDASGNPIAPTPGGASPSWISQIISAVTGKDPSKGGTAAFIGDAGNIGEAIQRFMVQRSLQNPADVLKNSQVLSGGLSKALKRGIEAPVTAAAQETGQINAPGLYSQSVATALAPYRYQQQQDALKEYLAAMQESMGAYPGTGGLYGPYGGYGSYPGEQQQTAAASPG